MNNLKNRADVLVIGGGIIGLATSYELAGHGTRVATIFPSSGNVEAASRAAGAMLGAFGEVTADDDEQDAEELAFRVAAQRRYPDWLAQIRERSGKTVQQAMGTFIISNNAGVRDRASIRRMKSEADRHGEPAHWVEPEDVPGLKASPSHAPLLCLHLQNEHSVDSDELMAALFECLRRSIGWQHVDTAVAELKRNGGNWTAVLADGAVWTAPHAVICAGSRSMQLLAPELRSEAGLPELHFGKGVSCVVATKAPLIPQTIRTPNRAFACGIHVVPRSGGRLYIGATNCLGVDHDRERGMQPGELHNLFDETIHQINGEIRCSAIEELRVGFRPITALRRPLVGNTRLPGLSIATGTYRNGILMAPLVSNLVAAEIMGQEPATENIFSSAAPRKQGGLSMAKLADIGIRDIIAFLHEPRGALPYNRAEELEKYVRVLFEMSVLDAPRHDALRDEMRRRLETSPLNETMHKLFYEVVAHAEGDLARARSEKPHGGTRDKRDKRALA
jgi:glycine oxidase